MKQKVLFALCAVVLSIALAAIAVEFVIWPIHMSIFGPEQFEVSAMLEGKDRRPVTLADGSQWELARFPLFQQTYIMRPTYAIAVSAEGYAEARIQCDGSGTWVYVYRRNQTDDLYRLPDGVIAATSCDGLNVKRLAAPGSAWQTEDENIMATMLREQSPAFKIIRRLFR
jgi:hypothetical protein